MSINGALLAIDPPPRFINGRLMVPVRRILDALGLPFERVGNRIETQVADRTIWLAPGSVHASVNGTRIMLDARPIELKGILYAPLRFFTAGLGAQAVFDRKTQQVAISSALVGESTTVVATGNSTREYQGIVEAIDNDSQPPSITITSGASVKTIAIASSARVSISDVVANTSTLGTLQDIHVGDYSKIYVRKDGVVDHLVAAFASRHGKVKAVSGNTLVLSGGHVLMPTGVTALSLNGLAAKVADLQVGDSVTARYNLDTSEVREIIATRRASGTPAPAGPVSILSLEPSIARPLRQGESFEVAMHATPGGQATYDLGSYFANLPLRETSPGFYTARYTIPRGANFSAAPLFGHLRVGTLEAARAQSVLEISASNTPPGISDIAPEEGQTVNNAQPSIYATFVAGAVPINVSSMVLVINGHDVTASATRSPTFIEYHPMLSYADGPVHITVRVADLAGNTATKSWTFSIRTR
ncbi:MAG: stalk domain-containing protein [Candidatus Eremiobacteraeota bacterium]|nr:stalk domain-containing protein [Candidatus Eremiobacteraeota bacterium]